jgi:cell wall-associated NlpC family hydrolase
MSRKHPVTRIASLTLATLLLFTTAVSAATGSINATDVKFRKAPDTSADILEVLQKDTPIEVISKEGDWYEVSRNQVNGYVYAQFVTVAEETAARSTEYGEQIKYVNANSLNIRAMPTAESEKLGELFRRNKVAVITNIVGWARVRTADGLTGYVLADYLVDTEAQVSRGNEEKVERLLKIAQTFLGVRYVHGGNSMKGTDCSGFVKMAFAKVGITTPRASSAYGSAGIRVARENLRPGDVVTFDIRNNGAIGHVGIYLGGDQFIHASSTKGKVVIARFSTYNEKYMGARRFIR